ncbi:TAXI family TRAP transporter solute-binding subunit [uncultured Nocardioides sp.]|uniref:TAXI family TRAP transporter solute-binding subunit n=1 Tax=uncultured Nocardioides sp. TaxID=198441 RepID=UPI00262C6FD6|nr:TAXI family TRAP transporter solute-binding subunit [uncultured Nocardioides sp.]
MPASPRRPARAVAAAAAAGCLALAGCASPSSIAANGLPEQMVWATYGTGTSTYADVAAVSDAITTNEGTPVRVITSDTAIGRMAPLKEGPAQFARTGDEYIFGFEGSYDFTTERWGPQDVRVVWAPIAPHGLMVLEESGIDSFEDLRGAKFPDIIANPSVNEKLDGFLAYGGLTRDDVETVPVAYGDQTAALQSGAIDVQFQQVYGSSLYELDATDPVQWLDMTETDPERIEALTEIAPSIEIGEFSGAAGQEEGESAHGMLYSVPVVTYADTDPDVVYRLVRAIADNYPDYADVTATTEAWAAEKVWHAPKQVPFHEGLVRFLEEEGYWTEQAEEVNDDLVERGETLRERWPEVLEDTDPDDLDDAWSQVRAEVPAPEPIEQEGAR